MRLSTSLIKTDDQSIHDGAGWAWAICLTFYRSRHLTTWNTPSDVTLARFPRIGILQSVNFTGGSIISTLPAFTCMTQYAPGALRALSHTRLIKIFTAAHPFRIFRTVRCVGCQKFGSFLFLLDCSRCCFHCLQTNVRFRAIDIRTAKEKYGLQSRELRGLPTMLSLPGTYALTNIRTIKRSIRLVSAVEAYRLSRKIYGVDTTATLASDSIQSGKMMWRYAFNWDLTQGMPGGLSRQISTEAQGSHYRWFGSAEE